MITPPISILPALHGIKPDLAALAHTGILAADMHLHTRSSDGLIRVPDLLKATKNKGAWTAITDHNDVRGALEAFSIDPDPCVIPGIEVSCREGPHILIWFYESSDLADFYKHHIGPYRGMSPWMAISLSTEDVIERARFYSSVISAAHPFGYWCLDRGLLKCAESGLVSRDLAGRIDALEVISGGMPVDQNQNAEQTARDLGLGMTGGSDSHLLSGVWGCVTTGSVDDGAGLLDAIRARKTGVIGAPMRPLMKIASAALISVRFAPYCIPSLGVHVRQTINRVDTRWKGRER